VNERLKEALRRKIERHNKFIRLFAVWSGFLIAGMWAGIYFFSRWAILFGRTIAQGTEAEMPKPLGWGFLLFVGIWLAAGWVERKAEPGYLRSNDRSLIEVLLEIALFPPRATFAAFRHLHQRVALAESELEWAATLLNHVGRAGKLPVEAVSDLFPLESDAQRLTETLKTLDLVYIRRVKDEEFLVVADPERLAVFLERGNRFVG